MVRSGRGAQGEDFIKQRTGAGAPDGLVRPEALWLPEQKKNGAYLIPAL